MKACVDPVTFRCSARQYVADIILNMLIVVGTFGLLVLVVVLFGV